jgi:hypothetical protein
LVFVFFFLVEYLSGVGLGVVLGVGAWGGDHFDDVAVAGVVGGADDAAVNLYQAVFYDALDGGAGEVADAVDEVLVDAAGEVFGDAPLVMFDVLFVGFDGRVVFWEVFGHGVGDDTGRPDCTKPLQYSPGIAQNSTADPLFNPIFSNFSDEMRHSGWGRWEQDP